MKKRVIKKKVRIFIVMFLLLTIAVSSSLFLLSKTPKAKIVGSWTTDGVTIYKFNRNNTGSLIVSLKEYDFKYKINKDTLEIDFKNEKSTDSKYTYTFKDKKLLLEGDNGSFTFIRKK